MTRPTRLQRRRRRGWRMPEDAVYVGRPSRWGNPFWITRSSDYHGLAGSWFVLDASGATHHPDHDTETSARQRAVDLYAARIGTPDGPSEDLVRSELGGRDLVCWCPLDEPCHADVLLRIAADTASDTTDTGTVSHTAADDTGAGTGPRPATRVRRPSGRSGPHDLEAPR